MWASSALTGRASFWRGAPVAATSPGDCSRGAAPDCKLDQVTDLSGVVWDLDDDDYTDEGSYSR